MMIKVSEEMKEQLPTYSFVGGYPLFYIAEGWQSLCTECAKEALKEGANLEYGINWEDPNLHCDICSERIESAYAEE